MLQEVINVQDNEKDLLILERAFLETQARENILTFMVANNMLESDNYNKYWEEYLEYLKAYRIIGNTFIETIVQPKCQKIQDVKKWFVNFDRKEVVIDGE